MNAELFFSFLKERNSCVLAEITRLAQAKAHGDAHKVLIEEAKLEAAQEISTKFAELIYLISFIFRHNVLCKLYIPFQSLLAYQLLIAISSSQ